MTKQQKTYLLLIAVLAVWGLIGYQFFKKLDPAQETVSEIQPNQKYIPTEFKESKSYTITGTYRDPFLGKIYSEKKKVQKRKKTVSKKEENKPFPTVIYNGIVEGDKTASYTVTINGKQELLKVGQALEGVTLLKATSEEISVHFNTITKTIKQH